MMFWRKKPKIEFGELIAKPNVNGGYDLYQYYGPQMEWVLKGSFPDKNAVKKAIANLQRPMIKGNIHDKTTIAAREGKEE